MRISPASCRSSPAAGVATGAVAWAPSLGVDLSWRIDGLSLTFALLISGIGTLIVLFSGGYLKGHPRQGRFFSFMLMFMGAMQGLVLADGFITLFVFWELTSITSFLLIGFDNHREPARRAAFQALVVTGMGGLSLLAGLLLVWNVTGAADMSSLLGPAAPCCATARSISPRSFSCSAAPSPNRRSSRSISGCPTPCRRRPRSRPICIRRPW